MCSSSLNVPKCSVYQELNSCVNMNEIMFIVVCLLKFLCAFSRMGLENAYADLLNTFAYCEMLCTVFSRGFWEKEENRSLLQDGSNT